CPGSAAVGGLPGAADGRQADGANGRESRRLGAVRRPGRGHAAIGRAVQPLQCMARRVPGGVLRHHVSRVRFRHDDHWLCRQGAARGLWADDANLDAVVSMLCPLGSDLARSQFDAQHDRELHPAGEYVCNAAADVDDHAATLVADLLVDGHRHSVCRGRAVVYGKGVSHRFADARQASQLLDVDPLVARRVTQVARSMATSRNRRRTLTGLPSVGMLILLAAGSVAAGDEPRAVIQGSWIATFGSRQYRGEWSAQALANNPN